MPSPTETSPRPQRDGVPSAEPGSFRDPESRVFYSGGEVFRALSRDGLADYEALASTKLFERLQADGQLVQTELLHGTDAVPDVLPTDCAGVLRHERIPFVSYPYEWPFSMLKDAALLQLDVTLAALEEGMILKDSTPYNVQFKGARPVFVDIGSFERLREGEPWVGRRQFCMLYLYPLMMQANKGIEYHPFLRGAIDGVTPAQMRGMSSFRDRFRKGAYLNIFLQAKLEAKHASKGVAGESKQQKDSGLKKEHIVHGVRGMRKVVESLEWEPSQGVWVEYGDRNSYSDDDARRKDEFVREVSTSQRWPSTWDIGANNGRYSRIAAEGSDQVLAVDADQGPMELLYRGLRKEGDEQILSLTMNLADPSPGLGWRGLERKDLASRGTPDLVLALALIHHVTIAANVPVAAFVDWLASLDTSLVIEFPTREDPMVRKLLAPKRDGLHPDYERESFERVLAAAFDVERRERLQSGTRLLYFARPKGAGNPIDLAAAES